MNFFTNHIFPSQENNDNHHHIEKKENKNSKIKRLISDDDKLKSKIENNQDKICCICLENIGTKKVILSNCRHELHIKCSKEWFFENAICPLCRSEQNNLKERICHKH
mgnify:CR=1 FL=1